MSLTLHRTLAPMPTTTRGKPGMLDYSPDRRRFAYPCNTNVIIRSLDDETDFDVFQGHRAAVTAVKFSPNGAYIASGDASGHVLVWDTLNREEHITKLEKPTLSGPVASIDWSGDGQRLVAGGEGKEFMAVAFSLAGSSIGELGGHGKRVNAVAFRKERPYRIATASEDMTANFYSGPPFRFTKAHTDLHTKQVNDVAFCPSGKYALTVSSDKKIAVLDGKTGDHLRYFPSTARASLYRLAWSLSSPAKDAEPEYFCTVGAEKALTVYSWADEAAVATLKVGTAVSDMTVACKWTQDGILMVTLDGRIHLVAFDAAAKTLTTARVYGGHQFPIVSVTAAADGTVVSGDRAGAVVAWDVATAHGTNAGVFGTTEMRSLITVGETIQGRNSSKQAEVFTAAAGQATHTGNVAGQAIPLQAGVSADGSITALVTQDNDAGVNGSTVALPAKTKVTAVAVAADGSEVAFGAANGKIFTVDPASLAVTRELEFHPNEVTVLAYGPAGWLLSGDKSKRVTTWAKDATENALNGLEFHNGRVRALAFAPGKTTLFASGGNDGALIVWDASGRTVARRTVPLAHIGGIFGLAWLSETRIVTAGEDACLRVWDL